MNDVDIKAIKSAYLDLGVLLAKLTGESPPKDGRGIQDKIIDFLKEKKEPQNIHQIRLALSEFTLRQVSDCASHSQRKGVRRVAPATYQWGGK